jgi:hypothetical protein
VVITTLPSLTSFKIAGFKANRAKEDTEKKIRTTFTIKPLFLGDVHSFQMKTKIEINQKISAGQTQAAFKNVRLSFIQF